MMRALWDFPVLPYKAVVPWPQVYNRGVIDWVQSVDMIEDWLDHNVGPHWAEWTWCMWTLHNPNFCGVSFNRERNCSLFILKFS